MGNRANILWNINFKNCESLQCTSVTYTILDMNYISTLKTQDTATAVVILSYS